MISVAAKASAARRNRAGCRFLSGDAGLVVIVGIDIVRLRRNKIGQSQAGMTHPVICSGQLFPQLRHLVGVATTAHRTPPGPTTCSRQP
jgi:hypothetical protein